MTKRELFHSLIPQIAEIIAECSKMSYQDYCKWKAETLESIPERAKEFMYEIMLVIDDQVVGITSKTGKRSESV